jgi:hypothetical protein
MARAKSKTASEPTPAPVAPVAPSMPWASPGSLSQTAGRAYLPGERPHYLCHMPGQFMAMAGYCVPALQPLYAGEAGVNGVDAVRSRDGKRWVADPEPAIVKISRRGGKVIPHEVDAEAGYPSYLIKVPGTNTFCHRLQELVPGLPPQGAEPDAYAAWLRSLMDRGVLEQPHPVEVKAVGARLRSLAEANQKSGAAGEAIMDAWNLYRERALTEQVG